MNIPNKKRTKIIATIGPSSQDKMVMKSLMESGVNVFRFNMKHGDIDWHSNFIKQAREVSKEVGLDLGILIDLQGPEMRLKTFSNQAVEVESGDLISLYTQIEKLNPQEKCICVPIPQLEGKLEVGDILIIDDGAVSLKVIKVESDKSILETKFKSQIKNNKSINLLNKDVDLPSLTKNDMDRILGVMQNEVDFVALSMVRNKRDVETLSNYLKEIGMAAQIISKIENKSGVENIEDIIEASYGIMVARGDLGVETPIEGIAYIQKELVKRSRTHSKPVIVATQMLESMINSKFPTRAEVADVANAVFDSTDSVMLSGETAFGANPIQVVEMMTKICTFNEFVSPHQETDLVKMDYSGHISVATVGICKDSKINKIIALTETGYTPRVISSLRPNAEIIAVSEHQKTANLLTMTRGVTPFLTTHRSSDLSSYDKIIDELLKKGLLVKGEVVVAIHGRKFGEVGGTNSLMILEI